MSDPYANMPEPKSEGDYPDQFKFTAPSQSVEGVLVDTRWKEPKGDVAGCQVLDIQQADGNRWSVFCGPTSLARQIYNLRPPIGSYIRVTFTGFDGQAKVFQVDVAPGPAAAQQAAPAPAFQQSAAMPLQPGEQPFGQPQPAQAGAPWSGQQPAQQQAPAAPWGQ